MFVSFVTRLRTLASIALVLLVCIGFLFVVGDKFIHDEGSSVVGEFIELDDVLKTEVARIAAESKGRARPLAVSSPPPVESARPQAEFTDDQDQPMDPRYTYTQHFGEMHVAPMPQTSRGALLTGDEPDWLDHPNPLAELRRLASSANRTWTFGWILMASDVSLASIHAQLDQFGAEILGASGRMIRVKLPIQDDVLESIAALSGVQRIGFTPQEMKVLRLNEEPQRNPFEASPLLVTLMGDDAGRSLASGDDSTWRRRRLLLSGSKSVQSQCHPNSSRRAGGNRFRSSDRTHPSC